MTRRSCLLVLVLTACGGDDDHTAPTIVSITPAPGAAEVWVHDPITIVFSEPIATESITDTSVTLSSGTRTAALSDDGTTLAIRADAAAAVLGTLQLDVTNTITDTAGNALAEPATATYELAAWSRPTAGLDRGAGPATPVVAVTNDGASIVAWTAGAGANAEGRRILVSRIDATGTTALGGELGAQDSALPSIVVDGAGTPVVVWSQFPTMGDPALASIQAARWDGTAWMSLPSPGAGSYVVAAAASDGTPVIAWRGDSAIAIRTLDANRAWQPIAGGDIALTGELVGLPGLSAPTATAPVVGFIEQTTVGPPDSRLRVFRNAGNAWTEQPAFPLGPPPAAGPLRMSLAATAADIFVAFDHHNGQSYDAHVITLTGNGVAAWQRLGTSLDVDPPADAQAPDLQLDATKAPVVAWRERVEGNWRGFVMRWDAATTTWIPVGGDTYATNPLGAIVRPRLALAAGRTPVVAWGDIAAFAGGATSIHLARFNGPAEPRFGRDTRASITGCSLGTDATNGPPATLSATGCFTIAAGKATPHAGLMPFDLRSELWSDGALKRRWLALPDGATLTTPTTGAWSAPPGTMIIKEFALETTPGDGRTRTVMETRFLVNGTGSGGNATWSGFSYRWRADGTDADLLPDAATTADWPLSTGATHTHSYPSRSDCARCHHASNGPLLGLRTGQLARRADFDGVMAEQLPTLAHLGVIAPASEQDRGTPFAAPHDSLATPLERIRGYLAANCSHCHNPAGERPTRDFRWETPLAQTNLCAVVTPGSPSTSLIYQRISSRPGMPPLATLETDPLAVTLVSQWIAGISSCP